VYTKGELRASVAVTYDSRTAPGARSIHYTAENPVSRARMPANVSTLCCSSGRHCDCTAGGCCLSDLPGEDQGRLPCGRAVAAGGGAGAYAADLVDRRRLAVCRGGERLQERVCRTVAAGGRLAGAAAHLLHRAPRA